MGSHVPSAVACFTFDNMAEAAEIGSGRLSGPIGPHEPSLAVGYPALFRLLEKYGVRATFFVEGWNGAHHPQAVAGVVERGHELGMHGWLHETWRDLEPALERELAERASAALERASGVRPRGFRAPGGHRTAMTEYILSDLGYRYDASLGDGMRPRLLPSGLAQIPFRWAGVDGFHYLACDPPQPPERVRDLWIEALRRSIDRGGLFVTVCHAFVTGVDDRRLAALEAVVEAAVGDNRVRVCTAGEAAEAVRSGPSHGGRREGGS
jgi:peptidoglycan/xylan/chitin deacetylase (PgdA/CDA1 family)